MGWEFHRYIPGIGQDNGRSLERTSYLCCAFAGIKSCSTVPALSANLLTCLFCCFLSGGNYNNANLDRIYFISRRQTVVTNSRSAK